MDRLETIFAHQFEQTSKFHRIQHANGCLATEDIPVDLRTFQGTLELHKGLHWINLELSEVLHAREDTRLEELADVLHFLAEFTLMAGLQYSDLPESPIENEDRLAYIVRASEADNLIFTDFETNVRFTILAALRVADILKNKPWKQTLRVVDHSEFKRRVLGMWYWYGACIRTGGYSAQDLFDAYLGKEKINYQRVAGGV